MRNRIFGLIGVLWGGGIIVSGLVRGGSQGAGAYQLGQTAGFVFGGLLFVVGLFYLIRGSGKKTAPPKEENPYASTITSHATGTPQHSVFVGILKFLCALAVLSGFSLVVFVAITVTVFGKSTEYWPGYVSSFIAAMAGICGMVFVYRRAVTTILGLTIIAISSLVLAVFLSFLYVSDLPWLR